MKCDLGRAGWCAACYAGVRGRGFSKGHAGLAPPSRRTKGKLMLRRAGKAADDGILVLGPSDPGSWAARYPSLWQFITACSYEDGSRRSPGSMAVFFDQGRLKCCLNDKECQEVCFVTGVNMEELMGRVEAGLDSNDLEWRSGSRKSSPPVRK